MSTQEKNVEIRFYSGYYTEKGNFQFYTENNPHYSKDTVIDKTNYMDYHKYRTQNQLMTMNFVIHGAHAEEVYKLFWKQEGIKNIRECDIRNKDYYAESSLNIENEFESPAQWIKKGCKSVCFFTTTKDLVTDMDQIQISESMQKELLNRQQQRDGVDILGLLQKRKEIQDKLKQPRSWYTYFYWNEQTLREDLFLVQYEIDNYYKNIKRLTDLETKIYIVKDQLCDLNSRIAKSMDANNVFFFF